MDNSSPGAKPYNFLYQRIDYIATTGGEEHLQNLGEQTGQWIEWGQSTVLSILGLTMFLGLIALFLRD